MKRHPIAKKLFVVLCAVGLTPVVSMGAAKAAPGKVPQPPSIILIRSEQLKTQLQRLYVTVEKPSDSASNRVLDVRVTMSLLLRSGKNYQKTCVIKGKSNSCVFDRIPQFNTARPKLFAVARNSAGVSKKSKAVSFTFFDRIWSKTGYDRTGRKLPLEQYKQSLARVVNGNSSKWKKFQAINRNSVSSASAVKQAVPRAGNPTVIFNITGTVGIALPENSGQATQSGMFAVRSDGTTVDSLMPGSLSAQVRDFYSAPNGRFYVAFSTRTALEQGGPLCALGEVNASTGVTTCVDSTVENVALTLTNSDLAPVQFDSLGNIYYTGRANSKFVLRKSINGTVTDIINENIFLGGFVVLADGSVLLNGTTVSPSTPWFRRLAPNGSLANLVNQGTSISFMAMFPDGNLYFGARQSNGTSSQDSIKRYLPSSQSVDTRDWLSIWSGSNAYNSLPGCSNRDSYSPLCFSPSSISKIFKTTDGRVFGLTSISGAGKNLISLYPSTDYVKTVIDRISLVYQVGTKLVLAGTSAAGVNLLTVYEPSTGQETVIVDQTNETEIYSVAYVPQTGKLLFNGLKFSNNSLVVGEVDLP